MDFEDYLPSAILTLLFLAITPFGRDVWMKADTLLATLLGLGCVFMPETILDFQVAGRTDGIHQHLYQLFGLMLLSTTLFAYLTWKSNDAATKTAILWGRVVGISVYIMSRINALFNTRKGDLPVWNNNAIYFGIYGDCLWFMGNLIYALGSTDWGGSAGINNRLNLHLWLDFIQTFLFAFVFYVFPGHMLGFQATQKLRGLHLSIARMFASFLFNSTIIAGKAPHFLRIEDKYYHLLSRLVINACMLTAQLYTHYTTQHWSVWHIYVGMIGISVFSINAALGYFDAEKSLKKAD